MMRRTTLAALLLVSMFTACPGSHAPGGGDTPRGDGISGQLSPGGGGGPLPAPTKDPLPEIDAVPGFDPEGSDGAPALERADRLFEEQNWKEAEAAYAEALTAGLKRDPAWRTSNQILLCRLRLGDYDGAEEAARDTVGRFLDTVDEARAWRILGNLYLTLPHHGTEKGGRFHRGVYDQGIYRFSYRADRRIAVRALEKAREIFSAFDEGDEALEPDQASTIATERVEALFDLVTAVVSYGPYDATWNYYWWGWTDYDPADGTVDEELNPYGYGYGRHGMGEAGGPAWPRGIPVSPEGEPIFQIEPDSYSQHLHPGQKMKYLLSEIERIDPTDERDYAARSRLRRATLAKNRYGTQRLSWWSNFWYQGRRPLAEELEKHELWELGDSEALTLLGRRFAVVTLPPDEDVLALLSSIEKDFPASKLRAEGLYAAGLYLQGRQQHPRAIETYEAIVARHPDAPRASSARSQIEALKAPEAAVGPTNVQLAGTEVRIKLAHRNLTRVRLKATRIDLKRYIDDIWRDIASDEEQKRYYRDPGNLSYDLLHRWEQGSPFYRRYLTGDPVTWEASVEDDGTHRRSESEVPVPPTISAEIGTWVVEVDPEDALGKESRNLLLVQDLALVEKRYRDQKLYLVVHAGTGEPIPDARVRILEYWQEWKPSPKPDGPGRTIYHHETQDHPVGGDGILLASRSIENQYPQAIAMATTPDGRLAFTGIRYFSTYSPSARQSGNRALVFTDRPVYRPGQKVQVKVWVRQMANGEYQPPHDGASYSWSVTDPRGQQLASGSLTGDEFGGGSFDVDLPPKDEEPPLGLYQIYVSSASWLGGNTFRVEEYRKPEFEVAVQPGADLARLGEEVSGTIEATYLFGAPVADARVAYRIYRENYVVRYAPHGPWDWLYGPGYGWVYYDYPYYWWWGVWGCKRFAPWRPWQPERELVSEGEGRLSAEGTLPFTIDTAKALADHPDLDHRYVVVAEVTDASRRTITGEGAVIVTRDEFSAFVDVDRGYYRPGQEIVVSIKTMTATGTPVSTPGKLTFARILHSSEEGEKAIEKPEVVESLTTDAEGNHRLTLRAGDSGQFLLRFEAPDSSGKPVFGSAVIWVWGADFDGRRYRMNDLEILTDKRTYEPGDTAQLLVNANHPGARVLFASHTDNGVLLDYRILKLSGKSTMVEIPIDKGDVPNFFVEATTVFDGDIHQEMRELLVPPQESMLNVEVSASAEKVSPGGECRLTIRTTTPDGEPARAQIALSVFDRAVLQIQPEITPAIRTFFWGDRRTHYLEAETNLRRQFNPYGSLNDPTTLQPGGSPEDWDGGFGNRWLSLERGDQSTVLNQLGYAGRAPASLAAAPAEEAEMADSVAPAKSKKEMSASEGRRQSGLGGEKKDGETDADAAGQALVTPKVRKKFADTAFWRAAVDTTVEGVTTVTIPFPENLTTWRIKALGLTASTRAGEDATSVITSKDLIVRLAAPRFFTERDEVVLSANVHNYLESAKEARVSIDLPSEQLELLTARTVTVTVPADGEARVDWRVRAVKEGLATIGVEALTDEESDATQMAFPVLVHGFLKTVSHTGSIRPQGPDRDERTLEVPAERRPEQSVLSLRVSPSLGLAMLDALPYLIDYPYGCTEQTMSRFVPAVLTMKTLQELGVDLEELEEARTNLNPQQAGPPRFDRPYYDPEPVYSQKVLKKVIRSGLKRIGEMQRPDGGWGWWANDNPSTYLTAYVVWGLIEAREADLAVDASMLQRGIQALRSNVRTDLENWTDSEGIGNQQAWVAYVLSRIPDAERGNDESLPKLLDLLFERRIHLSLYGKALLSLALRQSGDASRADLVLQNARQKEQMDPENQTVFYPLETDYWWYWWHNDVETHAWMLRAVVARDPSDPAAPGLVKWLLNNRRNGTYWRSTRDTAIVISAFREFIQATGESEPDMTVEVRWDGRVLRKMRITKDNVFTFDNLVTLHGDELTGGKHQIEIVRQGQGAVYWNAELSYFTLEENVKRAGLELKVERTYYRLEREDRVDTVPGNRLQAVQERRVRYRRIPISDGDRVTSGDLLEVELKLTSKNDYDYLVFEDPKPAGCEPVEVRSGARWGELVSNMELRDEKVAFFVGWLNRGDHLIRYRLRAEAPGVFHTLPTRGWAMYAPELRANADELILGVDDREE